MICTVAVPNPGKALPTVTRPQSVPLFKPVNVKVPVTVKFPLRSRNTTDPDPGVTVRFANVFA